jgi:hypothetical protein
METPLKFQIKSIEGKDVKYIKRNFIAKIKALPEEGEGIIEAYVSVFGNADSYGEVVDKGAFVDFIRDYFPRYPKGVWAHDWEAPIAKTMEIREDEFGLYIKGKLILTVQKAKEAYDLIKEGVITDFSFGYGVDEDYYDSVDGLRHLRKLSIYEWSPVLVGANRRAELISVKSDGDTSDAGTSVDPATPDVTPAAGDPAGTDPTPGENGATGNDPDVSPPAEEASKGILVALKAINENLEALKKAVENSNGQKNVGGDETVDPGKPTKATIKGMVKDARQADQAIGRLLVTAKRIIKQ